MLSLDLTENTKILMSVICGILVLASIFVRVFKRSIPKGNYKELYLRIRSWWIMVVIFFIAISSNLVWAVSFFGFISFLALKEYLTIVPTRREDRRVLLLCYLFIPLQYYFVAKAWYGMFSILIPVYGFIVVSIATVLTGNTKSFLYAISSMHWGLMISVFSLSHMAYLFALPNGEYANVNGASLLVYLVFTTQFNDVAQYLWGRTLGNNKVVPQVSPNKTWEGLVGGVLTTGVLSAIFGPLLTPFNVLESASVGVLIGVSGFLGDITISALKRDLQIKDTGSVIPGHGGVLDRLDSLCIAAPLFFHLIRYVKY